MKGGTGAALTSGPDGGAVGLVNEDDDVSGGPKGGRAGG